MHNFEIQGLLILEKIYYPPKKEKIYPVYSKMVSNVTIMTMAAILWCRCHEVEQYPFKLGNIFIAFYTTFLKIQLQNPTYQNK